MTDNKIVERILKQYKISGFASLANDIPLADLQSLLIEVYNQRAKHITPQKLLEQYKKNRFVKPSKLNPQDNLAFANLAFQLLPTDFQLLELSPVCPLGSVSAVAPISQNMILTTIRNTEVCSDVTNVMALEASLQRKKLSQSKENKFTHIKLCTSHRLLRAQAFNNPSHWPHFQILSLCVAGRDEGNFLFELPALTELIVYYYNLISQYVFDSIAEKPKIKFIIFTHNECLLDKLTDLTNKLSNNADLVVIPKVNPDENWSYYSQIRFNVFLCDKSTNEELFIADGGDTTWTQQLLSDKKERFMISGLGSELLMQKIITLKKSREK